MTNKATKYGIMIIAAVLVIAMAFAGAASAEAMKYPISITNATGTYQLTSVQATVYGDYGVTNGTATVEEYGDAYILTLTNFKASNFTSGNPLINASVPNLKIKLVGDSNLTGSNGGYEEGLLYSSGNLTISTDVDGKLLVNTSASGGTAICADNDVTIKDGTINANGEFSAIYANKDVSIVGGTVNATATGSDSKAIYADYGNITIDDAANVDARANSISGNAYSLWAPNRGKEATKGIISITGNSVLKANAAGPGDTYALYAGTCEFIEMNSCDGSVIIDENSEIEAIATSSTSSANPILAHNNIMIGEGTVVNATALSDADWAYSIYSRAGNITISDANTVNAYTSIHYTADVAGNSFAIYADGYIAVDSVGILNATSDALGEWHYSYAMSTRGGPVTIIDSPDVTIHAYSDKADSYAISAGSVEIESSIVNATVTTETNYDYITAIEAGGRIHISDSIVSATATGFWPYAIGSWSGYVTIENQSTVDLHAIDTSAGGAYALYSYGDISVINSTLSEFDATSNTGEACAMYSDSGNLSIANSTINNLTSMCESGSGYVTAICVGNFSITDSILHEITATSDSGWIETFWGRNGDISSSQIGKVTAYCRGSKNANAFYITNDFTITDSTIDEINATSNTAAAYAMYSDSGNLSIADSTIGELNSTSDSADAYVMYTNGSNGDISITNSAMNATSNGSGYASALYAYAGNISISGANTVVDAQATSSNNGAGAIYAYRNIQLDSANVNATSNGSGYASALYAYGNLTISGANTVVDAQATSSNNGADAIYADDGLQIESANVNAISNGSEYTSALYTYGNINITGNDAKIDAKATSSNYKALSAYACQNILIDSVESVTAIANGYNYTSALYTDGNLTISGANTVVDAQATSSNNGANTIYASDGLQIESANVNAISNGSEYTSALYTDGNINITGNDAKIDAKATSSNYKALLAYASQNILIDSVESVTAIANGYNYTSALYAYGNLTISGANTVVDAQATSSNYGADAICACDDLQIESANVNATSNGYNYTSALYAYGNLTISGSSTITADVINGLDGVAIGSYNGSLTISDCNKIVAKGSVTSFAVSDLSNLSIGALQTGYTFSNATVTGAEPNSYNTFTTMSNWYFDEGSYLSNFTSVKIEAVTSPVPQYTPSSHSSSAGSVLLQPGQTAPTQQPTVAPTVKPTVKPTDKPVAPTVVPTVKPTAQPTQTQASPAPVLGIIAGLGAAAVLLRLRK